MNVLLDTHTLLWLVSTPGDVDASALAVISNPNTGVWVTAASAWEIDIKTRLGRLDGEAGGDAGPQDLGVAGRDRQIAAQRLGQA